MRNTLLVLVTLAISSCNSVTYDLVIRGGRVMDPETGLDVLVDTVRFITPGNVLGLPSVALPTGVADGLPTGVQIYADLWREDLCLEAAELAAARVAASTPIDPATHR
mgnify:CR=1 FL=1